MEEVEKRAWDLWNAWRNAGNDERTWLELSYEERSKWLEFAKEYYR